MNPDATAEIGFRARVIEFPDCEDPWYPVPPVAINDRGQVVGFLNGCWWDYPIMTLWDPETGGLQTIFGLPDCGSLDAHAELRGMNELGHLVGYDDGQGCNQEAWFWSPETGSLGLGDLPGGVVSSAGYAINNHDQVIGRGASAEGHRPFLWSPSTGMLELPNCEGCYPYDINDSSWIVGDVWPWGAILWTPEDGARTLQDRTGGPVNPQSAYRINNRGQVLGLGPTTAREFYVWDRENGFQVIAGIGSGPDWELVPTDFNDLGEVVGFVRLFNEGENPWMAFLWDAQRGFRYLEPLLDPCTDWGRATGLFGMSVRINNSGHIAVAPLWGPAWVLTPYIPGDLDENEVCELQDLAIQLSNFARSGDADYAAGDLDCDQDVDLEDLAILLGNFGETLP